MSLFKNTLAALVGLLLFSAGLASGSLITATTSVATFAPGTSCTGSINCRSEFWGPRASGTAFSNVWIGDDGQFKILTNSSAQCFRVVDCQTVGGDATASFDLVIDGEQDGIAGRAVIEYSIWTSLWGQSNLTFAGATFDSMVQIANGRWEPIYDFTYGSPIHISANVSDRCTECQTDEAGVEIDKIVVLTPEPASWLLAASGLLVLSVRRLHRLI